MKKIDYIISDLKEYKSNIKKEISALFQDLSNSILENDTEKTKKYLKDFQEYLIKEDIL